MNDLEDEIDLSCLHYSEKIKEPTKNELRQREMFQNSLLKYGRQYEEEVVEKEVQKVGKKEVQKVGKKEVQKVGKEVVSKEDEKIQKRRLILLIKIYKNEFGKKLEDYKNVKLEKLNVEELEDLKREMDLSLSSKSVVTGGVQMISTGIYTLEYLLTNFGVKCQGLSTICNDPETIDDMKHIVLKRCQLVTTEPEARLMYKLLQSILILHNTNNQQNLNIDNISKINEQFTDI